MLSNIVYIVILLLLLIILGCIYFFFNDIRKNKNKINICESDISSLRERLTSIQQKVISMDNSLNDLANSKKPSKTNLVDENMANGPNFAEMLEKLGSMNTNFYNNEMFNIDNEDEDEDVEDVK